MAVEVQEPVGTDTVASPTGNKMLHQVSTREGGTVTTWDRDSDLSIQSPPAYAVEKPPVSFSTFP